MDLKTIAQTVKTAHAACVKALQSSLTHAKTAGEALAKVSATCQSKDGKSASQVFVAWCKKECGLSESTAYNYIRIHKNWVKVQNQENYVKALKALRTARKPKANPPAQVLSAWQQSVADKMMQHHIKASMDNMTRFLEEFGVKEPSAAVTEERMAA